MSLACAQIFDGPGQPLRTEQLPLPDALAPGEVLVAIDLATICGSDLHTLSGLRQEPTPLILGHEAVGHVVATERADLKPGDRISWSIADSCGTCPACSQHLLPEKCDALFKYGHAPVTDGSNPLPLAELDRAIALAETRQHFRVSIDPNL